MPITLTIDQEAGLLICRMIGMTDRGELLESIQDILRLRTETGVCLVLVDATMRRESLGMMELVDMGQALGDDAFCGTRLAVFSNTTQLGMEFARSVTAQNHGCEMRTFGSELTARDWLNSAGDV
jgi:hypothetical protein